MIFENDKYDWKFEIDPGQHNSEKVVTSKYRHTQDEIEILELCLHTCQVIFVHNEIGTHKPLVGISQAQQISPRHYRPPIEVVF